MTNHDPRMHVALALLSLAAAAAPARAGDPPCALLPNGTFADGQTGWTFDQSPDQTGDASAYVQIAIVDGTGYGGGLIFDEHVVAINASAVVGLNGGLGTASAEAVVSTARVTVTAPILRVRRGGGFEYQFNGDTGHAIQIILEVEGPGGAIASGVIYDSAVEAGAGCELALAILGTLNGGSPTVTVDLAAGGIGVGDEVDVRLIVRAESANTQTCQWDITEVLLVVDDFEFCAGPSSSPDLDGDGSVGFGDLLILLAGWGACPAPPAACPDLDGDGAVGFSDVLVLLGAWS